MCAATAPHHHPATVSAHRVCSRVVSLATASGALTSSQKTDVKEESRKAWGLEAMLCAPALQPGHLIFSQQLPPLWNAVKNPFLPGVLGESAEKISLKMSIVKSCRILYRNVRIPNVISWKGHTKSLTQEHWTQVRWNHPFCVTWVRKKVVKHKPVSILWWRSKTEASGDNVLKQCSSINKTFNQCSWKNKIIFFFAKDLVNWKIVIDWF